MTITRRPAEAGDEPFLYSLYSSTRADEMAGWGWDEMQKEAFLSLQFRAQRMHYSAAYPDADHQILLREGRPVGRTLIDRSRHEIQLVDIALIPEERNGGIGTGLLQELLDEAAREGRSVGLHVLKNNTAYRLYSRLGFTVRGDDGIYLDMVWSLQEG